MANYKEYGWQDESFTHAHNYLIPSILEVLEGTEGPILDVGCGNGAVANFLIEKGFDAYGTDLSKKGIEVANKINKGRFYLQDVEKDEIPDKLKEIPFKTIISTEVIEHLYDPRSYIKFCKQVLESNGCGKLIISTPYHGYLKNLALALTGKMDQHFTVLWDGGHIKFWSYQTLKTVLEEFSFDVIKFKGSGRIPYLWKSMIVVAEYKP